MIKVENASTPTAVYYKTSRINRLIKNEMLYVISTENMKIYENATNAPAQDCMHRGRISARQCCHLQLSQPFVMSHQILWSDIKYLHGIFEWPKILAHQDRIVGITRCERN